MIGELIPTCDRKTKFWKNQQNTYGLLPGLEGTCPCATTAEGGCWNIPEGRKLPECYVARTMSCYKGVYGVLEHNTQTLKRATEWEKVQILDAEFGRFRTKELRHLGAEAKSGDFSPFYRLHWSGDIFDEEYARAIASAVQLNSDIRFWCYTRSFFAVPILCNIPNLILYLSLDPVNVVQGMMTFTEHKKPNNHLQFCYMSKNDDFKHKMERVHDVLRSENKLRKACGYPLKETVFNEALRTCPVDVGSLALEGGCAKCKQCISSPAKPVWFKV